MTKIFEIYVTLTDKNIAPALMDDKIYRHDGAGARPNYWRWVTSWYTIGDVA
jgi:hypothetical protein